MREKTLVSPEIKTNKEGGIEMLIGLIADTHDNLPLVDRALGKLNQKNVELVLHAGDYIAPFVIPKFKKLRAKLIGVLGNNDGDRELLKKKFNENERLEMHSSFAEISVEDLKIALLHGDEEELLNALINSKSFDVVVHGHTHKAKVYNNGETLVVNPGEACGYLSDRPTIALLNTDTREAKIIEL